MCKGRRAYLSGQSLLKKKDLIAALEALCHPKSRNVHSSAKTTQYAPVGYVSVRA